jgi:hypothetical protein
MYVLYTPPPYVSILQWPTPHSRIRRAVRTLVDLSLCLSLSFPLSLSLSLSLCPAEFLDPPLAQQNQLELTIENEAGRPARSVRAGHPVRRHV